MMFNDHVLLKRELTATEPKYGESVIHEIFMLLKCPLAVNITAMRTQIFPGISLQYFIKGL